MSESIVELYKQFRDLPFPRLGYDIGNFVLFDSLVAGAIDSYLQGRPANEAGVAPPDDETYNGIMALREKTEHTEEETYFLKYVDTLEQLQSTMEQARDRST